MRPTRWRQWPTGPSKSCHGTVADDTSAGSESHCGTCSDSGPQARQKLSRNRRPHSAWRATPGKLATTRAQFSTGRDGATTTGNPPSRSPSSTGLRQRRQPRATTRQPPCATCPAVALRVAAEVSPATSFRGACRPPSKTCRPVAVRVAAEVSPATNFQRQLLRVLASCHHACPIWRDLVRGWLGRETARF
jgi:hypothetical protein